MGGSSTETETLRATKRHRCTWCWQFIERGETYKRFRFFMQGDAGTNKMHPECHEAMEEIATQEGGWYEWVPGMERPEKAKPCVAKLKQGDK